jgi:thiol-disulfide isomerase/thioredoxin
MRTIHIFLIALFVLLILLHLTRPSYDGFEGSSKSIVICKADWCGHCKKAAPEFDKLMAASPLTLKDGTKVVVKVLDADQNKDEMKSYNVKGFPSILIQDGSRMVDYPGERTYNGVLAFLNNM